MNISILGCGWLGFPLGLHLQRQGHLIKGSTTTGKKLNVLSSNGITPYLINIQEEILCDACSSFWDCDVLFINIPPGRKQADVLTRYPAQVKTVLEKAGEKDIGWIIFASSTSVYSTFGGLVREEDVAPDQISSDSGRAIFECETILKNCSGPDATIIRFGGLYGYERHPVRYLAGRKNMDRANKPINLIHRDDCIEIVSEFIRQKARGETFNAVSDGHPPRCEFYKSAARHFGLPEPTFTKDTNSNYTIVSNQKLKESLGYEFIYPNPMDHTP